MARKGTTCSADYQLGVTPIMLLVSIIDPSKEDVTRLSALIERYFRRSGTAYVQRVYQSGMEFVRSAENSDIVFLETNLEKLDGLETARIIRKLTE